MHKDQLLLLLLLFLVRSFSIAIENNWCTTSCGEVTNISSPFRLRGDPKSCGHHSFELSCVNNCTVYDWFSSQYYVRHIDYTNFTIRLADVGLQKGNCSSLPRHSLGYLRSSPELYWYGFIHYDYKRPMISKTVAIVDCTEAVDSRFNIDASSCLDGNEFLNLSSKRRRVYAIVDANVSYVGTSCTIELMAMIPWWADGKNLRSYEQIHNLMVYGFELSWLSAACEIQCKHPFNCDVSENNQIQCNSKKGKVIDYNLIYVRNNMEMISIFGIGPFIAVKFILGAPCVMMLLIRTWRRRHLAMDQEVEGFLQSNNNFLPIRYSYSEIKKITSGLKDKLGEGGYAYVFKGRLRSGRDVAVKILKKGKANVQDFISEVSTIERIHHFNVVGLIGFCIEGSKQALIYDFMHHGYLDKHIFSRGEGPSLDCKKVYEIALGVARGIEYLHRGCNMQILHFDIKPHNILLDKDFTPKVSDFGLARLFSPNQNTVSLTAARGTLGYMAPELVYKSIGGISYKADVYSFGKLLMEMASGRKNVDTVTEHSSNVYFPLWVHDQLSEGYDVPIEEVNEDDKRIIKKMMIVALWCIQLSPRDRPSMCKVLKMLEGETDDLQVPPKPLFYPTEMSTGEDGIWTNQDNDTASPSSTSSTTYEASHLEHSSTSITHVKININST